MFDEDPEVNPTLVYMLKRDFDFALPPFDPDPDTGANDLISYFLEVQEATSGRSWHVEDSAWLGQFNFKKLAMYRDLEVQEPAAHENPRVSAIAGLESFPAEADIGPPEAFDQVSPAEIFSVKDADRSQTEALLRARAGQNLIIQGPPGTGKSQTITNLIAQFLRDGKKVLFASEKMAALSVVHRRLEEVGLGPYCLEIHSDKANKRDTLARIDRAWNQGAPQVGARAPAAFQALLNMRQELNEYARVLHEPVLFGRSAFEVHAQLARLDQAPQMTARLQVPVAELTSDRQMELLHHARRLAQVPGVLVGYAGHPWNGCLLTEWSMDLQDLISRRFTDLASVLTESASVGNVMATEMAAPTPACVDELLPLLGLAGAFALSPCPPLDWFEADIEALRSEARDLAERQARYHDLRAQLLGMYTPQIFEEISKELVAQVEPPGWRLPHALRNQAAPFQTLEGSGWDLIGLIRRVAADLDEILDATAELASTLSEPKPTGLDAARTLVKIGEEIGSDARPTSEWCDISSLSRVEAEARSCTQRAKDRETASAELAEGFSEHILHLPLVEWRVENAGRYGRFYRILFPGYRQRLSEVRAAYRGTDKLDFRGFARAVALGADIQEIDRWFEDRGEALTSSLGLHYRGADSDWAEITRALGCLRTILDLLGSSALADGVRKVLLTGGNQIREMRQTAQKARQALSDLELCLPDLQERLDLSVLLGISPEGYIETVPEGLGAVAQELEAFIAALGELRAWRRSGLTRHAEETISDAKDALSTVELEREIAASYDTLARRYPSFFDGLDTDWPGVIAALDWTSKFNPIRLEMGLGEDCLNAATDPQCVVRVRDLHPKLSEHLTSLKREMDFLATVFARPSIVPGGAVEQMPIESLVSWVRSRLDKIGDLSDWVQFQALKEDAERAGLAEFLQEAVERSIDPDQLEDALQRRLLVTQLDEIYRRQRANLRSCGN